DYTSKGAKTFGAYVNGKLWVPSGRPGFSVPNFYVHYDSGYRGGKLEIQAHRKIKENEEVFERMSFGMAGVDHEGVYYMDGPNSVFFTEQCDYFEILFNNKESWVEITKLDLQNGIISGKFEFTLIAPGCDTIRVTGGRFDSKLY